MISSIYVYHDIEGMRFPVKGFCKHLNMFSAIDTNSKICFTSQSEKTIHLYISNNFVSNKNISYPRSSHNFSLSKFGHCNSLRSSNQLLFGNIWRSVCLYMRTERDTGILRFLLHPVKVSLHNIKIYKKRWRINIHNLTTSERFMKTPHHIFHLIFLQKAFL
ncbi:hypothetical protein SDC9_141802 [bioreactor metagenome]|uniref:Uncharacterized protein n=1 Tax=bioreactor metagenome TaxID=1076179 RepID=A0A645DYQ1_9ZZZZ